jgi:acetylglutamate kinase
VTDALTLDVTERVLAGSVNKALVRALLRRGVEAAGISGEDGGTLVARKIAPIDGTSLGFVGEISAVRTTLVAAMLDAGFTPVVAPLAVSTDAASALNLNADTAAGALAGALSADLYVVITNFDGGMAPKIESVIDALRRGAKRAIVCGSGPDALADAIAGKGTAVTP